MKLKGKAVTDMTLVNMAINNTNEAFKKTTVRFSCEVKGSLYGNKFGDVVADSIRVLKQRILAKRNMDKVLKTINIKIFIHDSDTMIDYNKALPIIDKIAMGIRDFVGPKCRVNFASCHKHDTEPKFCFECNFIEGDY